MPIKDKIFREWLGLNTRTKDPKALKDGEAQDSLNWLTGPNKDHIELRMGMSLVGKTRIDGLGKITGLNVGVDNSGKQIPFYTYLSKIKYYDSADDDTHEIGTDILGAAASGEDIAIEPYANIVGAWMYFSSPNSSIFKLNLANIANLLDLQTDIRGLFKIDQSRSFFWNIKNKNKITNKNSPVASYVDKVDYSEYTNVASENYGSGDGTTKTFTHTLAQIPGADYQTAFSVSVTDGTETFYDDLNGNLAGSLGGTGTVNYITGAVSVTFNTAPTAGSNNITCSYYYDTRTESIVDFSYSNPRTSGQGIIQPQYGGGILQNIFSFNGIQYCMHLLKTWALTIPADDTTTTNYPYRSGVGIPFWRAGKAIDDGVIYLDFLDNTDPTIRWLTLNQLGTSVIPDALSDNLDLTKNGWDFPVAEAWGNYYLMSCQSIKNGVNNLVNNITYLYNKLSGFWDKLDTGFTCGASYNGQFIFGDTISNNLFQLFSGYDDDGGNINNYWISKATDCDSEGLKRVFRFLIDGYINQSQSFDIYAAYDHGNYVKIGTINGNGTYVDTSSGTLIGTDTVGLQVVGSGAVFNAYHFRHEFPIASDIFEFVTIKFVATNVGALQINQFGFRDIRYKGRRTIPAYESEYATLLTQAGVVFGQDVLLGTDLNFGTTDEQRWVIFGSPVADGSWKLTVDGENFKLQKRESGVWNDKETYEP